MARHLYTHGKTLIEVVDEDLVNGRFTFPEGVTKISKNAFYLCLSLVKQILHISIVSFNLMVFWDTHFFK